MQQKLRCELLSPAGSYNKFKTAIHYGADAVYLGGGNFGLRAFSDNFTDEDLKNVINEAHALNKKVYITVNIYAGNDDLEGIKDYLIYLDGIKADAVIVSDLGILSLVKKYTKLDVHVSTQANTTNYLACEVYKDLGAQRIVLARELSLNEIRKIREKIDDKIELEAFVHGAMCISYSGRCLLSNFLTGRNANKGQCVQACRWEYEINEITRDNKRLKLTEDLRGTYILNSKDLKMIEYIDKLIDAGVYSFKIEGRMKSEYYVATVTNAYRRAIDNYLVNGNMQNIEEYIEELNKTSNRGYETGFYFKENKNIGDTINLDNSQSKGDYDFIAEVLGYDEDKKAIIVEQRNRFKIGDELEILSSGEYFNEKIKVNEMFNEKGETVLDAMRVQEKLFIKSDKKLKQYDILRKKAGLI